MFFQKRWFVLAGFLLVSFVLYVNNLNHEFVFDDVVNVLQRSDVQSLQNVFVFFTKPYSFNSPESGAYRPLLLSSIAMNYAISGIHAWSYQFMNILLHGFTAYFVYLLSRRLLNSEKSALCVSLLFLFHPLHTEIVNGVVNRSELLAGLFGIFGLNVFMKEENVNKKIMVSGFLFLLAAFSKEHAVMFFVIAFGYWASLLITKKAVLRVKELVTFVVVWVGYLSLYFSLRYVALGKYMFATNATIVENPLRFAPTIERFATALHIFGQYVVKLIFPFFLSSDYSLNQIPLKHFTDLSVIAGLLLLVGFFSILLVSFFKNSKMFLMLSLFLLPYMVTSNLFFPVGTIMAERLLYVPSIGFLLFLAHICRKFVPRKFMTYAAWVLFVMLSLWTIRIWTRNKDWSSQERLFLTTAKTSPNSVLARSNAGAMYFLRGDLQNAKNEIEAANAIYDKYPPAVNNLGLIRQKQGDAKEAERLFKKTLEIEPNYENAVINLARLYFYQERWDEVIQVAKQREERLSILSDLALLASLSYAELGQSEQSENYLQQYLIPLNYGVSYVRGSLAFLNHNMREAQLNLEQALREQPVDAYLLFLLGRAYKNEGNTEKMNEIIKILSRTQEYSSYTNKLRE